MARSRKEEAEEETKAAPAAPAERPRWILWVGLSSGVVGSLLVGAAIGVWAGESSAPAERPKGRDVRRAAVAPRASRIEGIDFATINPPSRRSGSISPDAFSLGSRLGAGPSAYAAAAETPRDDDEGFRSYLYDAHRALRSGRETPTAFAAEYVTGVAEDARLWARRISSETPRPEAVAPDLDRVLRTGDLRGDPPAAAPAEIQESPSPIFREDLGVRIEPLVAGPRVAVPSPTWQGTGGDPE